MRRSRPGARPLLAASAAIALLVAGGCYIDIDDHDDDCWVTPVARVVDEGEVSCIAIWPAYEAEAYVVRSDAEWATFWAAHAGCWGAVPPLPAVDFSLETVVAVILNDRPTTGYRLMVDRIYRCDDTLEIRATETVPGPGCATTPATTRPYQILAVEGHYDYLYFSRFYRQTVACP